MKYILKLLLITLLLSTSSCMQTRYLTEYHIKNNIEIHKPGEYSNIETYSIFKGASYGSPNSYMELTGYKYKGKKAMVIGADKYANARKKFPSDNTIIAKIYYVELSIEQCQSIIDNYKILLKKIKESKPKKNEEIYHDYTVSDDLFISYRRKYMGSKPSYIDFWIDGEKFSVNSKAIMKKLNKFMKY